MKIADVFNSMHGISDIRRHVRSLFDDTLTDLNALRQVFPGALTASKAYDAASLVDAAGETGTITVTGAALGDYALVSFGVDLVDMTVTAYVSAANTVAFRIQNESGSTANLASTTLRALVIPRSQYTGTYNYSATLNPGSLADGAGETTAGLTIPGAALGDIVLASFSLDLQGVMVTGYVQAADTVELRFQNETGATVDLASGTVYVRVIPINQQRGLLLGQTTAADPASAADGVGETFSITVPGAALGDFVMTSFSLDSQDITFTGYVQSANTVEVRMQNEGAAIVDLLAGVLRVRVIPKSTPLTGVLDA